MEVISGLASVIASAAAAAAVGLFAKRRPLFTGRYFEFLSKPSNENSGPLGSHFGLKLG